MPMTHGWRCVFWLALGVLAGPAVAGADLLREQRIAAQIEDAILEGEPTYLDFDGQRFFAIYTRSGAENVRGAAILLHGRGANPNWPDVIQPLRTGLPGHGWDTLSIQLPVAAADAPERAWETLVPQAGPRIDAALQALAPRDYPLIVLIGHSFGARMAATYLGGRDPATSKPIAALVAVGLPVDDSPRLNATLTALGRVSVPVLDIYGERDLPVVVNGARERRFVARDGGNPDYTQVQIADADHFFTGVDEQLVARIRAWLSRL